MKAEQHEVKRVGPGKLSIVHRGIYIMYEMYVLLRNHFRMIRHVANSDWTDVALRQNAAVHTSNRFKAAASCFSPASRLQYAETHLNTTPPFPAPPRLPSWALAHRGAPAVPKVDFVYSEILSEARHSVRSQESAAGEMAAAVPPGIAPPEYGPPVLLVRG